MISQGYCKTLLLLIEELLRSLGVETVMLPAAEDELPLFLDKLGYTKMEEEQVNTSQLSVSFVFTSLALL